MKDYSIALLQNIGKQMVGRSMALAPQSVLILSFGLKDGSDEIFVSMLPPLEELEFTDHKLFNDAATQHMIGMEMIDGGVICKGVLMIRVMKVALQDDQTKRLELKDAVVIVLADGAETAHVLFMPEKNGLVSSQMMAAGTAVPMPLKDIEERAKAAVH
jgi:hypothetical protein